MRNNEKKAALKQMYQELGLIAINKIKGSVKTE